MSEKLKGAHVAHTAQGGVRVGVPAGTSLEKIFVNKALIKVIRGSGGCQTCLSGKDLHLQQFEDLILVELQE